MPESRLPSIKDGAYGIVDCQPAAETVDAVFLVYYREFDGRISAAGHAADGTFLDDLGFPLASTSAGRSIHGADPLGPGVRVALDETRVLVLDFLNEAVYDYEPPAPWAAAVPMKVGPALYWLEYEAGATSQSLSVRLMRADDLTLSGVTEVFSGSVSAPFITVGEWTPGSRPTRGHDFTETHAAAWFSWIDANFETLGWERIVFPLDGGPPAESDPGLVDDDPDVGRRAGLPLGPHQSLQQQTQLEDPPDTGAYPVQQWDAPGHDPQVLYTAWADSPVAVDLAIDATRTRLDVLTSTQILTYDLAGETLTATVDVDLVGPNPVGIHRLETPIPIVIDSGEGGEGE